MSEIEASGEVVQTTGGEEVQTTGGEVVQITGDKQPAQT
jgi:hypothetical protein